MAIAEKSEKQSDVKGSAVLRSTMRILGAEDDAPLASFVKRGLEAKHYAVDIAPDGEEAKCAVGESDHDLILLDLNLPRLDGLSVMRWVRLKKPSLPVLVATRRSRIKDRVQHWMRA